MTIHFQNSNYFFLIWLVFPLLYLVLRAIRLKRKSLVFFTGGIDTSENMFQLKGYLYSSILILFSLVFIIISITRPSWNQQTRTVEKRGRDVVFLIDVSKSMMADDLIPNRLERAKLAVKDAVNILDGDRVALVAFAGSAVVKSPLTNDYSFFMSSVDRLSVSSVSRGGSLIGDAIRYVNKNVFDDSAKAHRDIILITDGEDQESFPVEAAIEADKKGIRIIAIGLGDENTGRRIPVNAEEGSGFVTYEGREVWTKLDAVTLRKVAGATEGGQYLNVSTGTFDLAEIYSSLIKHSSSSVYEEESVTIYEERFQFFIFLSILFLAIALFQPFKGVKYLISRQDRNILKKGSDKIYRRILKK